MSVSVTLECLITLHVRLMNGLVHVMQQLHSLWHRSVVEVMFAPVLALTPHVDSEQKSKCMKGAVNTYSTHVFR